MLCIPPPVLHSEFCAIYIRAGVFWDIFYLAVNHDNLTEFGDMLFCYHTDVGRTYNPNLGAEEGVIPTFYIQHGFRT